MRALRFLLILSLFAAIPAQAQAQPGQGKGALVIRGSDAWGWTYFDDATMEDGVIVRPITRIAVFSSDSQFFTSGLCDGNWLSEPAPDFLLGSYHWVEHQMGDDWKENGWVKTPQFVRVYQATEVPADDAAWCAMLTGQSAPLLAEGIADLTMQYQNTCNLGPGGGWNGSYRAEGNLSAPTCPKGLAHLKMLEDFNVSPDAGPTCEFDVQYLDWPKADIDVKCIGQ
jgi:hypothetical protein